MFQPGRMAAALVCLCATVLHVHIQAKEVSALDPGAGGMSVPPRDPVPRDPVAPQAATAITEGRWEVRTADVTLSRTLERWSLAAGHKLRWDAARNFLIGAPDVYMGSFEGALEHLLSSPGIRHSDFPLEACIYANTPPLVRITRQGEQSRECAAVAAP